MPDGDPSTTLHRCKKLVNTYMDFPDRVDEHVRTALLERRVIPVTATFLLHEKDGQLFQDCRAGQILFVELISRDDQRGYANQDAVICLCEDFAGWSSDIYQIYCRMSLQSALGVGTAIARATVTGPQEEAGFHEEHIEYRPEELREMRAWGAEGDEPEEDEL